VLSISHRLYVKIKAPRQEPIITLEDVMQPGRVYPCTRSASMSFDPTHLILLLLVLAFWITILWAVITATKALQRIATSIELFVRQKEERGAH
jgi:hypothetical protein